MDEFSFINSIKPSTYSQSSLLKGIGDDAAVFRADYRDVVTAVDTMVEDVHFSKATTEPYHIGYRCLAANISDLAAMGATPAYYMVSLVIPDRWSEEALQHIYNGMNQLAKSYRMDLIGGDTVSGEQLMLSITVFGYVTPGKSRMRSHARPGDVLFATGTLGDSRAGLALMLEEASISDRVAYDFFVRRHQLPEPRVAFAEELNGLDRLALNDISDGIASEANEIAEASQLSLHIDIEQLPVHPSMKQFNHYLDWVLNGGEDFELLGAVAEQDWPSVVKAAEITGVDVTKVGHVTERMKEAQVFLYEKGTRKRLDKSGYTHLKSDR
ncbi:thiamine-phosphate kinase [Thalassobacillus hwangdonensis]|uniref:Thiamine-monophosphate kinase n=1 Tax=Thalassobacillus hwangdonensis TaxID=546108 RepID=A0ABW3L7T0_9BACI